MLKVTEITEGHYRIEIDEKELDHFMCIVASSENLLVSDVESLLAYVLTVIEQNWFKCVDIEPQKNNFSPTDP